MTLTGKCTTKRRLNKMHQRTILLNRHRRTRVEMWTMHTRGNHHQLTWNHYHRDNRNWWRKEKTHTQMPQLVSITLQVSQEKTAHSVQIQRKSRQSSSLRMVAILQPISPHETMTVPRRSVRRIINHVQDKGNVPLMNRLKQQLRRIISIANVQQAPK